MDYFIESIYKKLVGFRVLFLNKMNVKFRRGKCKCIFFVFFIVDIYCVVIIFFVCFFLKYVV